MRYPVRRVALAAALLAAVAGCTTATGGDTGFISADGTITQVEPGDRKPAPTLEGTDLQGNHVSSEDYQGKVLVVNVWGSWCGPCREEAPELARAAKELKSKGVQFLGLTTKSQTGEGAPSQDVRFAEDSGMTYPSIQDYDGEQQLGFVDSLPAAGIPTTWIIDRQGRVAARVLDSTTAPTLIGLVEDAKADS